jgi:hypothetical protein
MKTDRGMECWASVPPLTFGTIRTVELPALGAGLQSKFLGTRLCYSLTGPQRYWMLTGRYRLYEPATLTKCGTARPCWCWAGEWLLLCSEIYITYVQTLCRHKLRFLNVSLAVLMVYGMTYLTSAGLTPGGSSTVHIYTQTIHRTTQSTQTIHKTTQFTS